MQKVEALLNRELKMHLRELNLSAKIEMRKLSERSELPQKKKIMNQFIFCEKRVEEIELESEN
jgi:hypothetical protein